MLQAVVIGGVGDEPQRSGVPFDLQRRQQEAVGIAHQLRGAAHEVAGGRIGDANPVFVVIVLVAVLVVDRGRDEDVVGRGEGERAAQDIGVDAVGVVLDAADVAAIVAIDPAAVAARPSADPETDLIVDDRTARRGPELVARRAVLGGRDLGVRVGAETGQAGLGGDVAHRAAFRPRAEQGPLRSAQHLDPLQVEHHGQGVVGVQAQRAGLDRGVVDIDAGGARSGLGVDAADRNVVPILVEADTGCELGQIRKGLDVEHLQPGRREGADALRHLADSLALPRGGDHHFGHAARGRGVRRRRPGGARGQQRQRRHG